MKIIIAFTISTLLSIVSFSQLPGDNCASAVSITLPSVDGASVTTGTRSTSTLTNNYPAGSYCSSASYGSGNDGVYKIVVPTGGYEWKFELTSGVWAIVSIHSGCVPTVGNCLGGFETDDIVTTGSVTLTLSAGTYYIFIDTIINPSTSFNLKITLNIPAVGEICSMSQGFCSNVTYNFANTTSGTPPTGPDYNMGGSCVSSARPLVWYYMEIKTAGSMVMTLAQSTLPNGAGTGIDVDYVMWGPYPSLSAACTGIMAGDGPLQGSFSILSTETIAIGAPGGAEDCASSPALPTIGSVYVVGISNWSNLSGYITFNQTSGSGTANCNTITPCNITSVTATPGTCSGGLFDITGSVAFTDAPATGTMTVTSSFGETSVYSAPFTSPLSYTISNESGSGAGTVSVSFSADNFCTASSSSFTAPSCVLCTPVSIPSQSTNAQTVCQNGVFTSISVTAAGTNPTYKWYSNISPLNSGGTLIPLATNSSYTPPATFSGTMYYYCIVTGDCGTVTSGVSGAFTINNNPAEVPVSAAGSDGSICSVDTYTLSGSATNGTALWSGGSGVFTPNNTTLNAVYAPSAAEKLAGTASLTLTVTGNVAGTCLSSTTSDAMVITINNNAAQVPVSAAGSDGSICSVDTYTLSGSATNGTAVWSGGSGVFTPNNTTLNAVYTPSAAEKLAGTASLTLTVTGNVAGTCLSSTTSDAMVITINNNAAQVPVSSAGSDGSICSVDTYTLSGSATNGSGVWSGGTGVFTPNNTTLNAVYSPSAAEKLAGTASLTLTVTGNVAGTCLSSTTSDAMVITINNNAAQVPVSSAGSDGSICSVDTYTLSGSATNGSGVWSGGTGVFTPNNTTLNAVYTPSAAEKLAGTANLTLTVTGNVAGTCLSSTTSDVMVITINNNAAQVPVSAAGSDGSICSVDTYTLSGSATNGSGVWSGGTGVFAPNNTTLNAVYTPSAAEKLAGTVSLTLTVTGNVGCLSSSTSDAMVININNNAAQVPVSAAGSDGSICSVDTYTLSGSATNGTAVWSGGSGVFTPNNTTLNAVYAPSAAEKLAGTASLTLTVTGNVAGTCLSSTTSDAMLITINNNAAQVPVSAAGSDASICSVDTYTLSGSATNGSAVWSGGSGVFTPNNTTLNAVYTPSIAEKLAGTANLTLTVTGNVAGTCLSSTTSDAMLITINNNAAQVPVSAAGSDGSICSVDTYTLSGSATNGSGVWSGGTGVFAPNNTTLNAVYTPSIAEKLAGTANLTLTVTGNVAGTCLSSTTSDAMVITINNNSAQVPVSAAGSDGSICSVDTYTLSGSATNGSAVWSGGSGVFTPNNTTLNAVYAPSAAEKLAGTASLTLTVTGNVAGTCLSSTTSDAMVITINNNAAQVPVSAAGSDGSICSVDTYTLSGSATNGTAVWSGGSGVFTPNNTTLNAVYTPSAAEKLAGTANLTLTVTGNVAGTCLSSTTSDAMVITINNNAAQVPVSSAGSDGSICSVDTYTLSGSATNGSGVWSGGTGVFTPNNTTLNAVYSPSAAEKLAGTASLTLTVTGNVAGTCLSSTTSDVMVITINNNTAQVPVSAAGSDGSICSVDTYTLSGSATNGTAVWSGGSGVFTPNNTTLNAVYTPSLAEKLAGTASLTLTVTGNVAGTCLSSTTSDVMVITINNNAAQVPVSAAGSDGSICSVDTYTLSGSATNGTAVWSGGSGTYAPNNTTLNAVYTPSAAEKLAGTTSLTLTVTGNVAGTCLSSTTSDAMVITINNNAAQVPVSAAGSDGSICSVDTYTLSGSATNGSYVWSGGTGTYVPNNTTLNAVYTPSASEKLGGIASLTLTVTGNVAGTCSGSTTSDAIVITINNSGTITLLPPSLTKDRDTCFAMPIIDIRYFIGGTASGANVTGLPAGISTSYSAGILKISGTSTVSGIFPYSVNTTGICPAIPELGTITIRPKITSPVVSSDATNCKDVIGLNMTATASSGGLLVWSTDNSFGTILGQGTTLTPVSTLGTTTYYVREELNGCYGESSLINITVKYCDIDLPSAFTPDGDNVNDTWVLPHIDEIYPNNIVSIYNRWGIKVFESPKGQYESHKWDGKYNDKVLPVDSYFFIIEYNDSSKPTTNGNVTIVLQNK